MKKLNFSYRVRYSFSQPVTEHCYALRILPETNAEQQICAAGYIISAGQTIVQHPAPGRDGFGNYLISGRVAASHDCFSFCVTGTAWTRREQMRKQAPVCGPVYRYPTDLTRPGRNIRALYETNREGIHEAAKACRSMPGGEARGRAMAWMRLTGRIMEYRPGVTGVHTTAEEALDGGAGVCQDLAQVLISLLRLDGIPARYIAGLVIGEGATHAWAEAWCGGWWIGLDPTNGCQLTDDYIEVARGRDYRDCIMDRGIFRGCALQEQQVCARVSEYEPTQIGRLNIL